MEESVVAMSNVLNDVEQMQTTTEDLGEAVWLFPVTMARNPMISA